MIRVINILILLTKVCSGFFIPIATSSSINTIAKSIKLKDSTIVVSRNSSGNPVAFQDYCPHRGASFNNVKVIDDKVSCPYHGFQFDLNDGNLKKGLGVVPGCVKLEMIECIERSGLVWACVDGDDKIKPPPELEVNSDPKFRKISGTTIIKCPVDQLICNIIDPYHISYLHSFGNNLDPDPIGYKAEKISDTEGIATFKYNSGKNSMFNGISDVYNWYKMPYTAGTKVTSGDDIKIVVVHAVQLEDGYTKVFWELYRNWATLQSLDFVFESAMRITLKEDQDMLENCSFDRGYRCNGIYDKLQLLYLRSFK